VTREATVGTTAVLIGGLGMRGAELAPLAARLGAAGVRAVTLDNLQVGDGPRVATPSIEAQAEHAWRAIDAHAAQPSAARVVLFGLSMGGMIAATMTTERPRRVARLVLAATSPNTGELAAIPETLDVAWRRPASAAAAAESLHVVFGATAVREQPELVRAYVAYRLAGENGQTGRDFLAQLEALRAFPGEARYAALAATRVPTLVVAGAEDRLFPLAHARWIAERLACPLHVVERAGHMLHLDAEAEVARVVVAAVEAAERDEDGELASGGRGLRPLDPRRAD
jgi:pimeloyl-ACP methyl ester carboxylesterase